jgi:Holliday junction resolvase RusA-like endonuclease
VTSWGFTLPGQPPTVNHLYEPAWKTDRGGRQYKGKILAPAAAKYRDDAILIIRSAKPSGWAPPGQVAITWWFHLSNDIDCDNAMKVIHDAIQSATGIDDKRFLPCVAMKEIGVPKPSVVIRLESMLHFGEGDHASPSWDPAI